VNYVEENSKAPGGKKGGKDGKKGGKKGKGKKGDGKKGKGKKGGDKGKGKGDKGKGEKGKGKGGNRNDDLTAVVKSLSWNVTEETLRKDFGECGAIDSLRMPLNEEGKPKGIAFIQFKEEAALTKALEYNEKEYEGRTIYVSKAGEQSGKGGKDGKGKGKDGKGKDGKGKKGKGKKGGMGSDKMAARDGAIVEGAGKKTAFADSDDDDAPPAKKAKKAAANDSDSE